MNLPTKITVARIALIPLFALLYLIDNPVCQLIAVFVFIIASLTDWLDGYLARRNNQVTDLGKFLDPVADKVLVACALILTAFYLPEDGSIAWVKYITVIGTVIILSRELIVTCFRTIAAGKNIVLAADMLGKLKTVFQIAALVLLLPYYPVVVLSPGSTFGAFLLYAGVVLMIIATGLTIVSGVNYIVKNKQVLVSEPETVPEAPAAPEDEDGPALASFSESEIYDGLSAVTEVSLGLKKPEDAVLSPHLQKVLKKWSLVSSDDGTLRPTIKGLVTVLNRTLSGTGLGLAAAESFTGGRVAEAIVSLPGASEFFGEGVVCYSDAAKISRLGVGKTTLLKYGAASEQTAREMVDGVRRCTGAHYAVATTGYAGGLLPQHNDGEFFIAVFAKGQITVNKYRETGGRAAVIEAGATQALSDLLYAILKSNETEKEEE